MDVSYILIIFLLFGHILADFYFQPISWVESRNTLHFCSFQLYYHVLIHGIITSFVVYIYTEDYCISIKSGILVLVTHYIIDLSKSYATENSRRIIYFVITQFLHVVILVILWGLLSQQNLIQSAVKIIDVVDYKVLIIVLAYVVVWKPVSIFISMVLSNWQLSSSLENDELLEGENEEEESLQSAGDAIGKIERILILTFILSNQFSAIGFLLAAKSVFRFGDLTNGKDKKLTEYVMLGTLTSVAVTIMIGLIVGYLTGIFPKSK